MFRKKQISKTMSVWSCNEGSAIFRAQVREALRGHWCRLDACWCRWCKLTRTRGASPSLCSTRQKVPWTINKHTAFTSKHKRIRYTTLHTHANNTRALSKAQKTQKHGWNHMKSAHKGTQATRTQQTNQRGTFFLACIQGSAWTVISQRWLARRTDGTHTRRQPMPSRRCKTKSTETRQ